MQSGLRRSLFLLLTLIAGSLACPLAAAGDDWPMWRYDASHTAASPHELSDRLHLQWTHKIGRREQAWDDPLNHDLMPYDKVLEPIVKDGRMFVGFNDSDKVVAWSLEDGRQLWSYYTDGPVRFPPVAWKDRVIFASDDGLLHCVGAEDGESIWSIRGGPSSRKVLGNKRIISAWPARGGPVVADDTVYFAASIWPFMGTFIYAIDPKDGRVLWVNDGTSADYIKQPHSAPSFAGVAPQGTLVVSGNRLIVPGGRSVPAVFDRTTGDLKYFDINAGGKGNGGSFVIAGRDEFYVHTRQRGVRGYDLATGKKSAFMVNEPVLTDQLVYSAELRDDTPVIRAYFVDDVDAKTQKKLAWEVEADGRGDLVLAGSRLYAAGKESISIVELAQDRKQSPRVVGSLDVEGEVLRLLAAGGRLIAVTLEGSIHVFGDDDATTQPVSRVLAAEPLPVDAAETEKAVAASLLRDIDSDGGYVLWFGADNPPLIAQVLRQSDVRLVVVNDDVGVVDHLRTVLDAAGLYGTRVSAHVGTPTSFRAPPYIAHAVIIDKRFTEGTTSDQEELRAAYESVRPYGSSLIVLGEDAPPTALVSRLKYIELENASVSVAGDHVIVKRVGPLAGAADWTHQYGDVANTVKSNDSRVKLPLGVLWFGGNSNTDVLPRHGHGPPEQVVDGRLYVQGMNSLSCRDVYTGRVFWRREFDDLGTYGIYYDETYKDTPLNPAYNQVHIPGANGRGTNYVVTSDAIYLAIGGECRVLDPTTGKTVRTIVLATKGDNDRPQWGYIGVYDDVLLAGNGFANYRARRQLNFDDFDKDLKGNSKGFGSKSFDISASAGLVAFDRHTGQRLWQADARHSFLHNGIVAGDGKVYCLDKLPKPVEDRLRRRGTAMPESYRVVAIDARTGQVLWENSDDVFGTWLSYSEDHDLLLQAGAAASDRLRTEVGQGMAALRGSDGRIRWRVDERSYSGPCILHHDTILTNANSYKLSAGAFNLLDGTPALTTNPLTGEEQPWQVCRAYGCNNIIASENMLTFRSGAAGYYDLTTRSGTGNLGGFKSGCTSNLVVANGVLNAPDYTRTCSCAYQNQTSLGLVHMPEIEMWTINHEARLTQAGQRIERIGINFGAPGDRVGDDGTLWVEYPPVGGDHPTLDIKIEGDPTWYRNSSLNFSGDGPSWIGASGVSDATSMTIPVSIAEAEAPEGRIYPIARTSDDAEEKSDGAVDLRSSDLELVRDDSDQQIGLRFDKIDIPAHAEIRSAVIQFTTDEKSSDRTELVIQAIDSPDPPTFTADSHNISSRKRLPQEVTWKPEPWRVDEESSGPQLTPDLSGLIQDLIGRPGWEAGNAVAFVIRGSGKRVAHSSKIGPAGPRLVIDASTDEPAPPPALTELHRYTVRLHFAEPDRTKSGERRFDVSLQGKRVLENFDIVGAAGSPRRTVVREFAGIAISDGLTIELSPKSARPTLSGVELIRETD